jgi:general secretion pathway protein G
MCGTFWTYLNRSTAGFLEERPSNCQRPKAWCHGLTVVELLLVAAIVGILTAIAVPLWRNYIDRARNSAAIADIAAIESEIEKFQAERGMPPDTLAEVGVETRNDPWGNPYEYLRIEGLDKKDVDGKWRKDRFLVPINSDFDLYSKGKDGNSQAALTAKASHDDILRANNGAYVGLASEF